MIAKRETKQTFLKNYNNKIVLDNTNHNENLSLIVQTANNLLHRASDVDSLSLVEKEELIRTLDAKYTTLNENISAEHSFYELWQRELFLSQYEEQLERIQKSSLSNSGKLTTLARTANELLNNDANIDHLSLDKKEKLVKALDAKYQDERSGAEKTDTSFHTLWKVHNRPDNVKLSLLILFSKIAIMAAVLLLLGLLITNPVMAIAIGKIVTTFAVNIFYNSILPFVIANAHSIIAGLTMIALVVASTSIIHYIIIRNAENDLHEKQEKDAQTHYKKDMGSENPKPIAAAMIKDIKDIKDLDQQLFNLSKKPHLNKEDKIKKTILEERKKENEKQYYAKAQNNAKKILEDIQEKPGITNPQEIYLLNAFIESNKKFISEQEEQTKEQQAQSLEVRPWYTRILSDKKEKENTNLLLKNLAIACKALDSTTEVAKSSLTNSERVICNLINNGLSAYELYEAGFSIRDIRTIVRTLPDGNKQNKDFLEDENIGIINVELNEIDDHAREINSLKKEILSLKERLNTFNVTEKHSSEALDLDRIEKSAITNEDYAYATDNEAYKFYQEKQKLLAFRAQRTSEKQLREIKQIKKQIAKRQKQLAGKIDYLAKKILPTGNYTRQAPAPVKAKIQEDSPLRALFDRFEGISQKPSTINIDEELTSELEDYVVEDLSAKALADIPTMLISTLNPMLGNTKYDINDLFNPDVNLEEERYAIKEYAKPLNPKEDATTVGVIVAVPSHFISITFNKIGNDWTAYVVDSLAHRYESRVTPIIEEFARTKKVQVNTVYNTHNHQVGLECGIHSIENIRAVSNALKDLTAPLSPTELADVTKANATARAKKAAAEKLPRRELLRLECLQQKASQLDSASEEASPVAVDNRAHEKTTPAPLEQTKAPSESNGTITALRNNSLFVAIVSGSNTNTQTISDMLEKDSTISQDFKAYIALANKQLVALKNKSHSLAKLLDATKHTNKEQLLESMKETLLENMEQDMIATSKSIKSLKIQVDALKAVLAGKYSNMIKTSLDGITADSKAFSPVKEKVELSYYQLKDIESERKAKLKEQAKRLAKLFGGITKEEKDLKIKAELTSAKTSELDLNNSPAFIEYQNSAGENSLFSNKSTLVDVKETCRQGRHL